jgi:predicted aspartyl protease
MKRSTMAILGFLAMISLPPWGRAQEAAPPIRAGEHHLPFQAKDDLIYIHAVVNGSPRTLLVDTGAVFTIFTQTAVPTLNHDPTTVTINMAKGSILASRLPVGLALGEAGPSDQHFAFRLNAVVGNFKFLNAEGVVGLDILRRFKSVTFDFKNSVIILEDR